MSQDTQRPVIGISCGDINGIGLEVIIKTLADNRILELCTPVVFASSKVINFYRKSIPDANFSFNNIRELSKANPRQVNIYSSWEEEVPMNPGQLTKAGGEYAVRSLQSAVHAVKEEKLQALVTAPIHKKNVQGEQFNHSGHTPFFKQVFNANDVLMFMCADNMRIGLVTEHVPIAEVARHITRQAIVSKLQLMKESLQKDFGIDKPRIAVLGLNPHAGDEGLIGTEEEQIISPAIKEVKHGNVLVYGPYSADAFFARGLYAKFDGVLAMYHDQGLIPFKSLAQGEGINFTAGLPFVRTSPDHGTAFDIAGKNRADESSFREALFGAIEILKQRKGWSENRANPLKRMSAVVLTNAEDEKIEEAPEE